MSNFRIKKVDAQNLDQSAIKMLEVRPKKEGFYFVTLYQYKKEEVEHPDYFEDWLEFDGQSWDYNGGYCGTCYVCFIHKYDEEGQKL